MVVAAAIICLYYRQKCVKFARCTQMASRSNSYCAAFLILYPFTLDDMGSPHRNGGNDMSCCRLQS